jgi:hypothetical protein
VLGKCDRKQRERERKKGRREIFLRKEKED